MIYGIVIGGYIAIALATGAFSNPNWFEGGGSGGCEWYQAAFWPLYWVGVI